MRNRVEKKNKDGLEESNISVQPGLVKLLEMFEQGTEMKPYRNRIM